MSQTPDVGMLDGVVAPRILDAMRTASGRLQELGVRHALVGALAAGAHGYPRATKVLGIGGRHTERLCQTAEHFHFNK
jgi:hypothetical protein